MYLFKKIVLKRMFLSKQIKKMDKGLVFPFFLVLIVSLVGQHITQ
jgi:hypothetical protein